MEKAVFTTHRLATFSWKTWFRENWKIFFVLLVFVFIAYANSINNTFISDDLVAIPKSTTLGTIHYFKEYSQSFVIPFTPILYTIAYKIGGLNPIFYRLPIIIFHLGSVFSLFLLLSLITNRRLAFFTASLFAVHPILIESVAWISGGSYSRSGFFLLLSFVFYLLRTKNKWYLIASSVLFLFGLYSSVFAIVFPFILALYEFVQGTLRRHFRSFLPHIIIGTFFFFLVLLQAVFARSVALPKIIQYSDTLPIYHYNLLLQIPITVTKYIQLILFPHILTLYHAEVISYPELFIRFIVLILFLAMILVLYFKNKLLFFWLSFFTICISPILLPLGVASTVAERYVYLGSIGIIFTVAYGLYVIGKNKQYSYLSFLLFGIIMILLTARTIIRNNDWKTFESFWTAEAQTSPMSFQARNNMGNIYMQQGDFTDAIDEYKYALTIVPNNAKVNQNLGFAYFQIGDNTNALKQYQIALKTDPTLWQVNQNIAGIYYTTGKYDLAKQFTEKALAKSGPNASLYENLGLIEIKMGRNEAAKQYFQKALLLDPQNIRIKQELSQL